MTPIAVVNSIGGTDGGDGGSSSSGGVDPDLVVVPIFGMPTLSYDWQDPSLSASGFNAAQVRSVGGQNNKVGWNVALGAGMWDLTVLSVKGTNGGIASVYVNSVRVGQIDMYHGSTKAVRDVVPNIRIATAGVHRVELRMLSKRTASSNYFGGLSGMHFARRTTAVAQILGEHIADHANTVSVAANNGAYNSFAGGCRLSDGTILAGYRIGTNHTDGTAGIAVKRSTDGGVTFGSAITIAVDASYDYGTTTFTELSDGRVACTTWRRTATGQTQTADSTRVIFSSDQGQTWGAENVIASGFGSWAVSESGIVELPNGDLLIALWGLDTSSVYRVKCYKSTDDGVTWSLLSTIANSAADSGRFYNEAGIGRFADGTIGALVREENARRLFLVKSTDDGATWGARTQMTPDGQMVGAPKVTMIDGVMYTVQRDHWSYQRSVVCVCDGTRLQPVAYVLQPSQITTDVDRMLYGQVMKINATTLGVVHSMEPSGTRGDVYFTKVTRP